MTDKLFQKEHEIQERMDADNKVKENIFAKVLIKLNHNKINK